MYKESSLILENTKQERFYPEHIAAFDFEPTKDKIALIQDPAFGEGLIALQPVSKGEIVFRFTGEFSNEITLFSLQVRPGLHVIDPYVMGKVLHSCDPNMSADMSTLTFTATRNIAVGEYLTMDYDTTEDVLFRPFECHCGAENCRGIISGKLAPVAMEQNPEDNFNFQVADAAGY